jgi:T1SS-143 domain-containing protein
MPDANGSPAFANFWMVQPASDGRAIHGLYRRTLAGRRSRPRAFRTRNSGHVTLPTATATSVASVGIGGSFLDDGRVAAAPLDQIVNGDFSEGVWSAPDWWGSASTNVAGWTLAQSPVEPGTVDLERVPNSLYGLFSSTHGPMVDLGSSPGNIQITQTFVAGGDAGVLVNGQTYAIQFEAGAPFPDTAKLEVLWNGQVIGTIDPSGPGALTSYNYIVTANGVSDALTFREIGTGSAPIPGDYQGHGYQTEGYHGTYLANVKLVATYVVDEDGLLAGNHDLPAPSQGDAPGLDTSVTGSLGISWGADNYDSSTPDVDTDRFYQDNNGGVLTGRHVVFTDANIAVSGGTASHSLTSHGDAVVLSLSSDGTVLIGTATDANHVTREVFEVSLSDDGTGAFKFTLKDALDHAPNGSENDLNLTFNFTAVDSDGDTAPGTFTVGVDDDVPVSNGLVLQAVTVDEDGCIRRDCRIQLDALPRRGRCHGAGIPRSRDRLGTRTALVIFVFPTGLGSFGRQAAARIRCTRV